MLFGLLPVLLLSGKSSTTTPDKGFNPGEQIPSIVVEGTDIGGSLASEPKAVLVVWSVEDATSRMANTWVINNPELRSANTPIYSICIDGDDKDADFYSKIDGSNAPITPIGLEGESQKQRSLRELASRGSNKVYYTSYGMIEKVITSDELFKKIQ
ncbi:hypothetical protein IX332_001656 [Porphyromonas levii]|uniref:Uncharacterized protein n=2 Tax=Porphyromonas levii TaxID=28114 RepID=A0A4Y8WN01_9PORP|nr:hypothetical protein [Porphyromonas levii]MBR8730314.1 hypothetical protein [Porphyromonas levii]MBR8760353.1 hypothetical protein [Porphyromonas levii]MBR8763602.1 hypothetical protein [Porphyromonas levii]MBR8770513.1 hypothetical protein [Porphyromonas levii]